MCETPSLVPKAIIRRKPFGETGSLFEKVRPLFEQKILTWPILAQDMDQLIPYICQRLLQFNYKEMRSSLIYLRILKKN